MEENPPVEETITEEEEKSSFTVVEDAIITWFFYTCQISDYKKIHQSLPNRSLKEMLARFVEIQSSPELKARVKKEVGNDLLGYKNPYPSELELNYMLKAVYTLPGSDPANILAKYPRFFNPARTPGNFSSAFSKILQKNEKEISERENQFKAFIDKIHEEIEGKELLPFPGDYADPVGVIKEMLGEESPQEDDEFPSFEQIDQKVAQYMEGKVYGVLFGEGHFYQIIKTKSLLGRQSPKVDVDIDLDNMETSQSSKISRRHAELTIASDWNFYLKVLGHNVIVNGHMFQTNNIIKLKNHDIIDFGGKLFMLVRNPRLPPGSE